MPTVRLGNHAALDPDGNTVPGQQITTIHIPDTDPHEDRMRNITHRDGLWSRLAAEPPAWVASDDPELEAALARHFDCPAGEPDLDKAPDDARELTE